MILVSEADIFLSESLRILAERLSQSEIGLPLRQICYYSPPEEVGVFSTEINFLMILFQPLQQVVLSYHRKELSLYLPPLLQICKGLIPYPDYIK